MDDGERTLYNIPAENLPAFEAACAKLSRKAVRIGCGEIKPFIFGHHTEKLSDGHEHRVYEVLFTADVPKVDGWTFAARLDHANETGNIVRPVPNLDCVIPEVYRTVEPLRDHCKLPRRRKDTFVLRCDATGEFKQVGTQCLQDFFGHDPHKIARMAELLGYAHECARGYEDYTGSGIADLRYISMEAFAQHCAAMVRLYGWCSRSAAKEHPSLVATAGRAMDNMFPLQGYEHLSETITDGDRAMAAAALEWASSLIEQADKSDYEHNICVIADAGMIETRSVGLAASIVGVHARNCEREIARRAQRAAMKHSQHVGTVGERLKNLAATVLSHKYIERESGYPTYLYRFITKEGNILVWFASSDQGVQPGESVRLTGTVKVHDAYEGVNNTGLTRCKLVAEA